MFNMPDRTGRQEALLFLCLILLEAAVAAHLILQPRIPAGGDGWPYFYHQYYVLNNVAMGGEIPQWIPFMTHGMIATWYYLFQVSILPSVLLLAGSLLENISFIPLFHLGMLVDELLLLLGTWLLARRFFRSSFTSFFVAASVLGSAVWPESPWFNFHFYYAVPLILHFCHAFLETGKSRYVLAAGNLSALQTLGQIPYAVAASSLIIILYLLVFAVSNRREVWGQIKNIRFGLPFWTALVLIVLSFGVVGAAITNGIGEIVTVAPSRSSDASVSLNTFMTYGADTGFTKWLELLMGMSTTSQNLYCGLLAVPFAVLALLFGIQRKNFHFFILFLFAFLFSGGTLVTAFFYYTWPLMKYFRHISTVAVFGSLFLCFIAGFGLDAALDNNAKGYPLFGKLLSFNRACMATGGLMLCLAAVLLYIGISPDRTTAWIDLLPGSSLSPYEEVGNLRFYRSAIFAGLSGLIVMLFARKSIGRNTGILMGLLLFIHVADLFVYKVWELHLRTRPLTAPQTETLRFQQMPYAKRRALFFWQDNPRAHILFPELTKRIQALLKRRQAATHPNEKAFLTYKLFGHPVSGYGAEFWTVSMFFFHDQLGTPLRTDILLRPFDQFTRACWQQDINDQSITSRALFYGNYMSPVESNACRKLAGATEDKIQFFSSGFAASPEQTASVIGNPDFKGNFLMLSGDAGQSIPENAVPLPDNVPLSADTRLPIPYTVDRYNADHLELTVDLKDGKQVWLYYSDVWHPFWRASINEKPVPLYRANLAYKAVLLQPGPNKVHFHFKSDSMAWFQVLFNLNCLIWLIAIGGLGTKILYPLVRNDSFVGSKR